MDHHEELWEKVMCGLRMLFFLLNRNVNIFLYLFNSISYFYVFIISFLVGLIGGLQIRLRLGPHQIKIRHWRCGVTFFGRPFKLWFPKNGTVTYNIIIQQWKKIYLHLNICVNSEKSFTIKNKFNIVIL